MSDGVRRAVAVAFVGCLLVTAVLAAATLHPFAATDPGPAPSTGGSVDPAGPENSPPAADPSATPVPSGTGGSVALDPPIARLHESGVAGDGVRVGVVDTTGFDSTHPALAGRVGVLRGFGGADPTAASDSHGTATAATVARTAPNATLALATVGSQAEFARAVDWLAASGVDVIVAPITFYGSPGDGSSRAARAAADAVDDGVVVVAPAGNLARRHWEGVDDSAERTVEIGDDGRAGTTLLGPGQRAVVWLSWTPGAGPYRATLYRVRDGVREPVATSARYAGDPAANARLAATLGPGRYSLVVAGPPNSTGAHVSVTSPTHRLGDATPAGSVLAPATGRGVVGVGSVDGSEAAAYSARGPTDDGRIGVDVAAVGRVDVRGGRLAGTSAAAARVAGVAALIEESAPGSSPGEVERRLERTAADVGSPGVDLATGHGEVRGDEAVRAGESVAGAGNASERSPVGPVRAPAVRRRVDGTAQIVV